MASKIGICNLAVMHLGATPLMSLDDGSKKANALKSIYDETRDQVLADHPWNFATRRATLARLTAAPAFGYPYAYQLPPNCLRVLGMVGIEENIDPDLTYKIEGQQLLTEESEAKIKYILRVTDEGYFSARFAGALALKLAAVVAYHLTQSAAMKEQMMKEYQAELSAGRTIDAQEDTPEVQDTNPWIEARG